MFNSISQIVWPFVHRDVDRRTESNSWLLSACGWPWWTWSGQVWSTEFKDLTVCLLSIPVGYTIQLYAIVPMISLHCDELCEEDPSTPHVNYNVNDVSGVVFGSQFARNSARVFLENPKPKLRQEWHYQRTQQHLGCRMVGPRRGPSASHHPFPCWGAGNVGD